MIFYFILDDEYPEVEERSDVSVFKEKGNSTRRKIKNYLNMQARFMRLRT